MHLIADDDNNADLRNIVMEEDICCCCTTTLVIAISNYVQGRISSLCTAGSIEFVGLDVLFTFLCGGSGFVFCLNEI